MKFLLAIVLLLPGCLPPQAEVARVIDGDTVEMTSGEVVRLAGIDTPEKGQCGFTEASDALADLVLDKSVTVVVAGEDDKYGRTIAYLDVDDKDAGKELLLDGWAIARYDSRDGYGPHPREIDYRVADLTATDLGCYTE